VADPGTTEKRGGGMGRKIAIGCGVAFVVLFLAGAAIAWWFIGRPASRVVGAVRDVQRIESIRDGIRDASTYQAPQDGVLSEGQVERYLAVQRSMRDRLEGRVETLRERYETIDQQGRDPTPAELARAWADTTGLLVEATEAQVDALNAQDFSLAEYRWVRGQVLAAAGFAAPGYDVTDLAGDGPSSADVAGPVATTPPERNVELLAPHRDEIERNLPFAWFGL
jgi:hypothetical protein